MLRKSVHTFSDKNTPALNLAQFLIGEVFHFAGNGASYTALPLRRGAPAASHNISVKPPATIGNAA